MADGWFRLDGQAALVTGGGTGLGLAISGALAAAGARVVMAGRRSEPLQEAAAALGSAASFLSHDITDLNSLPGLLDRAEAQAGPLSILVNNAGIHLKKWAVDSSDAEVAQVVQTHLLAAYALSREAGRRMMERGSGHILMIASMAALYGIPQVSAYSAAKSGLVGLTRALAVEMARRGVRVNCIAPGFMETPMSRGALEHDPERLARVLTRTPMGRLGEPADVGAAAVYLCSPAAAFVTGVLLPVDGGISIGF